MRKRTWWRLGLGGLAGLACFVAFLWLTTPNHRIDRASFDQIALGMSQAEVEAILRSPPGRQCSRSAMLEMKLPDGSAYGEPVDKFWPVFEAFDGAFTDQGLRPTAWVGDRGLIVVHFDAAGKVARKEFGDMYVEGFLAKVRSWLARMF